MSFAGCGASAMAMVAVAAGAVCTAQPGLHEYERCFGELHLAALLTHADPISASRRATHTLGIPIIGVVTRPHKGPALDIAPDHAARRAARIRISCIRPCTMSCATRSATN